MITPEQSTEFRAILLETEANINLVASQLNSVTHSCPTCGLNKAEDWDEAQIAIQLKSAAEKIHQLRERLIRQRG